MSDLLTERMDTRMPTIRKFLTRAMNELDLTMLIGCDTKESSESVRNNSVTWPDSDGLHLPSNQPEIALRYQMSGEFGVAAVGAQLDTDAKVLSQLVVDGYRRAIIDYVAHRARPVGPPPDSRSEFYDWLRASASSPCVTIKGPKPYMHLKDAESLVSHCHVELDWPDDRWLLIPLTADGPRIEQLDAEFDLAWRPKTLESVTITACRRLYITRAVRAARCGSLP